MTGMQGLLFGGAVALALNVFPQPWAMDSSGIAGYSVMYWAAVGGAAVYGTSL